MTNKKITHTITFLPAQKFPFFSLSISILPSRPAPKLRNITCPAANKKYHHQNGRSSENWSETAPALTFYCCKWCHESCPENFRHCATSEHFNSCEITELGQSRGHWTWGTVQGGSMVLYCTVYCVQCTVHWQIFSYTKIVSRKSRKEKQGLQYMLLNERKLTELCLRHFVLRHRAIRKD